MSKVTLYQQATKVMRSIIDKLLELSETTSNFHTPEDYIWEDFDNTAILLCGKGYAISDIPKGIRERKHAWFGRSAIPFRIERAATGLLYKNIQPFIDAMVEQAFNETSHFTSISEDWIYENPQLLPVMMHSLGIFSKRELQKVIGKGTASDTGISRPVSHKLANLFKEIDSHTIPSPIQVKERLKATTEGIVRDLIGRLLLEDFVAQALKKEQVPFLREEEYGTLAGVVYDFRADFIIPNPDTPKAFIEVRKSSSGHASLYAKDKMFSAINWKGKHQRCLGIIVVDGPWTQNTLEIMSRVFDYVIPVEKSAEVAKKIKDFLEGDETVLRWLIQFRIDPYIKNS